MTFFFWSHPKKLVELPQVHWIQYGSYTFNTSHFYSFPLGASCHGTKQLETAFVLGILLFIPFSVCTVLLKAQAVVLWCKKWTCHNNSIDPAIHSSQKKWNKNVWGSIYRKLDIPRQFNANYPDLWKQRLTILSPEYSGETKKRACYFSTNTINIFRVWSLECY